MMKAQHLSPTVITDKNGKVTTVYTRPVGGSGKAPLIPAPALSVEEVAEREKRIDRLSTVLRTVLSIGRERAEDTRETLDGYPDELLERLERHFLESDNEMLGTFFTASAVEARARLTFISEMIAFGPIIEIDSNEIASLMVRGLHHYRELPPMEDYGTAPDEVIEQCRALIIVTEILDDHQYENPEEMIPVSTFTTRTHTGEDTGYMVLDNSELIKLVLDHPEEARQIAELVIERSANDIDLIRSLITAQESRPMNSGIL